MGCWSNQEKEGNSWVSECDMDPEGNSQWLFFPDVLPQYASRYRVVDGLGHRGVQKSNCMPNLLFLPPTKINTESNFQVLVR